MSAARAPVIGWLEQPFVKWLLPVPMLAAVFPLIYLFFRGSWRLLESDALAMRQRLAAQQSFLDVVESAAVEQPDRADGRVRAISVGTRHEAAVEPVEQHRVANPHDAGDHVHPTRDQVEQLEDGPAHREVESSKVPRARRIDRIDRV